MIEESCKSFHVCRVPTWQNSTWFDSIRWNAVTLPRSLVGMGMAALTML